MAEPLVAHDDLDLFMVTWSRLYLASRDEPEVADAEVEIQEPPEDEFPEKLIVVRTLDGDRTSLLTAERFVQFDFYAGTKQMPKPASDLARIYLAGLNQIPGPDNVLVGGLRNPVSALLEQRGPFPVPEKQQRAHLFASARFGVTAVAL